MKYPVILIMILCAPYLAAQDSFTGQNTLAGRFATQIGLYPKEKIHLHIDRSTYLPGDTVWFKAYLVHSTFHTPLSLSRYIYTELINPFGETIKKNLIRQNEQQQLQGYVPIPQNLPAGNYALRTYTRYMLSEENPSYFTRHIQIGYRGEESGNHMDFNLSMQPMDVTFYPEGGYLLSGDTCRVAFKALNQNGSGEHIHLTLKDDLGNMLLQENTFYQGMGSFSFVPQADRKYYAFVTNEKGFHQTFTLPEIQDCTYGITTRHLSDRIQISVRKARNTPEKKLLLVVHARGAVLYEKWIQGKQDLPIEIATDFCPAGVVQCMLLDQQFNIVSERLCFIAKTSETINCSFQTDKATYNSREQIHGKISLTDNYGKPVHANLSVAITDSELGITDTTYHILSTLLLTSEIKGWVENPEFYLRHSCDSAHLAADLLMMTQGWRRYDLAALAKGVAEKPSDQPEYYMSLNGKVKPKRKFQPGETGIIHVKNSELGIYEECLTDSTGRFQIRIEDFPEGSTFSFFAAKNTLSAKNSDKREDTIKIEIEDSPSPRETLLIPQRLSSQNQTTFKVHPVISTYAGNLHFHLPEIVVNPQWPDIHYYQELSRDDILNMQCSNAWELVEKLGVTYLPPFTPVQEGSISISGNFFAGLYRQTRLTTLFERKSSTPNILNFISPGDIESIQVYSTNRNTLNLLMGDLSNDPTDRKNRVSVLDITFIPSFDIRQIEIFQRWAKQDMNIRKNYRTEIYPLGYQKPVEFYSPKYGKTTRGSNDYPIPDLRPTLFWKPDLKTDSSGLCDFSFYSSDRNSTYNVVIEGITEKGELIHKVYKIETR